MQIEITSKVAEAVTQVTIVTLNSQQLIKNTLIKLVALSTLKSKLGATNIISSKLSKRCFFYLSILAFSERYELGQRKRKRGIMVEQKAWAMDVGIISVYFAGTVTLYQM